MGNNQKGAKSSQKQKFDKSTSSSPLKKNEEEIRQNSFTIQAKQQQNSNLQNEQKIKHATDDTLQRILNNSSAYQSQNLPSNKTASVKEIRQSSTVRTTEFLNTPHSESVINNKNMFKDSGRKREKKKRVRLNDQVNKKEFNEAINFITESSQLHHGEMITLSHFGCLMGQVQNSLADIKLHSKIINYPHQQSNTLLQSNEILPQKDDLFVLKQVKQRMIERQQQEDQYLTQISPSINYNTQLLQSQQQPQQQYQQGQYYQDQYQKQLQSQYQQEQQQLQFQQEQYQTQQQQQYQQGFQQPFDESLSKLIPQTFISRYEDSNANYNEISSHQNHRKVQESQQELLFPILGPSNTASAIRLNYLDDFLLSREDIKKKFMTSSSGDQLNPQNNIEQTISTPQIYEMKTNNPHDKEIAQFNKLNGGIYRQNTFGRVRSHSDTNNLSNNQYQFLVKNTPLIQENEQEIISLSKIKNQNIHNIYSQENKEEENFSKMNIPSIPRDEGTQTNQSLRYQSQIDFINSLQKIRAANSKSPTSRRGYFNPLTVGPGNETSYSSMVEKIKKKYSQNSKDLYNSITNKKVTQKNENNALNISRSSSVQDLSKSHLRKASPFKEDILRKNDMQQTAKFKSSNSQIQIGNQNNRKQSSPDYLELKKKKGNNLKVLKANGSKPYPQYQQDQSYSQIHFKQNKKKDQLHEIDGFTHKDRKQQQVKLKKEDSEDLSSNPIQIQLTVGHFKIRNSQQKENENNK